jgi:hypothetical protein
VDYFISQTLRRSPLLVVAFVGMVMAIVSWRRHPKVSLRTLLSLGLVWVQWVVFTIAFYFVAILSNLLGLTSSGRQWFYTGLYFVQDLVFAIILILLVSAALVQRYTSASTPGQKL